MLKKRLEDTFYLFANGINDLSHLVLLIIFETIYVLMTVDATCCLLLCSFLVPCRKVCFREPFNSLLCAAIDIF